MGESDYGASMAEDSARILSRGDDTIGSIADREQREK
jgi:hypothetical protein